MTTEGSDNNNLPASESSDTTSAEDFAESLLNDHGGEEGTVSESGVGSTEVADTIPDDRPPVQEAVDTEFPDAAPAEPGTSTGSTWQDTFTGAGFSEIDSMDTAAQTAVEALRVRDEEIARLTQQLKTVPQYAPQPPAPPQISEPEPEEQPDDVGRLVNGWRDVSVQQAQQWQQWIDPETQQIRENTPPEIAETIRSASTQAEQWGEVISDPRRLMTAIESRVQKMINTQLEQGFTTRQQQARDAEIEDHFLQENENWLYATDPVTGQPIIDPVTGYQRWSSEGERFKQIYDYVGSTGVQSRADQIRFAQGIYGQQVQTQQNQPVARRENQQPTVAQQRQAMLGQTNNNQPRQRVVNNVSPGAGEREAGEQELSVGDLFYQEMTRS